MRTSGTRTATGTPAKSSDRTPSGSTKGTPAIGREIPLAPGAASPASPDEPSLGGSPAFQDVRFAFLIQRSLLREVKQLALDRDTTTSDLLRAWIATAIEGGFDDLPPAHVSKAGRLSQFPVNLSCETRATLRAMSIEEDLSCAQLMRRLIVQGLNCARSSAATTPPSAQA